MKFIMAAPKITLDVISRAATKHDVSTLRSQGYVPGVLYGFKLQPAHIAVQARDLEKTWKKAGRTHIISLALDGTKHNVLIREMQVSPRSGAIAHVDFFAMNPKSKLTADVPITLHGESPAVSVKAGQLLQLLTTIKVECLPSDLPAHLTASIEGLNAVDDAVTVADLAAPHGVAILHQPADDIVAKIVPNRVQTATDEEEAEEAAAQESAEQDASGGDAAGE